MFFFLKKEKIQAIVFAHGIVLYIEYTKMNEFVLSIPLCIQGVIMTRDNASTLELYIVCMILQSNKINKFHQS